MQDKPMPALCFRIKSGSAADLRNTLADEWNPVGHPSNPFAFVDAFGFPVAAHGIGEDDETVSKSIR